MRDQIANRELRFDQFLDRIDAADVPDEIRTDLYRFGAILLCGHIEQCVKIIILDRLDRRADPRILNFVRSFFERGANLDCSSIKSLLERFEPQWGKKFEEFVAANDDVKVGIASAYGVRNPLAHGSASSLGGARLRELYAVAKRLVEAVVDATQEKPSRRKR